MSRRGSSGSASWGTNSRSPCPPSGGRPWAFLRSSYWPRSSSAGRSCAKRSARCSQRRRRVQSSSALPPFTPRRSCWARRCSPVRIRLPSAGTRGAACATWRARSRSAWRARCCCFTGCVSSSTGWPGAETARANCGYLTSAKSRRRSSTAPARLRSAPCSSLRRCAASARALRPRAHPEPRRTRSTIPSPPTAKAPTPCAKR